MYKDLIYWSVISSSRRGGYWVKYNVDILTGENLLSILDFIYWSVCSSSRRGGDRVKYKDRKQNGYMIYNIRGYIDRGKFIVHLAC